MQTNIAFAIWIHENWIMLLVKVNRESWLELRIMIGKNYFKCKVEIALDIIEMAARVL